MRGAKRSSDPAVVIAELERDLGALEREVADLRAQADAEMALAFDWETRAMSAVREGRDVRAREALLRTATHRSAAEALATEAAATSEAVDAYRSALTAMRAATS